MPPCSLHVSFAWNSVSCSSAWKTHTYPSESFLKGSELGRGWKRRGGGGTVLNVKHRGVTGAHCVLGADREGLGGNPGLGGELRETGN